MHKKTGFFLVYMRKIYQKIVFFLTSILLYVDRIVSVFMRKNAIIENLYSGIFCANTILSL